MIYPFPRLSGLTILGRGWEKGSRGINPRINLAQYVSLVGRKQRGEGRGMEGQMKVRKAACQIPRSAGRPGKQNGDGREEAMVRNEQGGQPSAYLAVSHTPRGGRKGRSWELLALNARGLL